MPRKSEAEAATQQIFLSAAAKQTVARKCEARRWEAPTHQILMMLRLVSTNSITFTSQSL